MSLQKRALVVDDSKSARLILRRMLEKHGIVVDTVESAAEALEFLTINRPDVIFMDHMMPGMDGFEAVRAIKGNPRTVTIPVMMYTSKGGDLYLGQARALGAVGVLPKTVAPAELYESLQRIGLVSERRRADNAYQKDDENASERLEDLPPHQHPDMPATTAIFSEGAVNDTTSIQSQLGRMLSEQRAEIRKDLLMGLDTVARQSREKLDRLLDEKIDALDRQPTPPQARVPALPMTLLLILLFISLVWNFTSRDDGAGAKSQTDLNVAAVDRKQDREDNSDIEPESARDGAGNMSEHTKQVWQTVSWALNQDTHYPWDEIALDGARMQTVAQLLDQLASNNFAGILTLETHVGLFCLRGGQETGFELNDDNVTLDQCSAIMNPVQPTDLPSTHQSLEFANFVASSPGLQDGTITLEIKAIQRTEPLVAYPPREETTKAAEWNRAAAANNRIFIRLTPR